MGKIVSLGKSKLPTYYLENEKNYINGYAKYLREYNSDDEWTAGQMRASFHYYMFCYYDIYVDLRKKFWKDIFNKALKIVGITLGGTGYVLR